MMICLRIKKAAAVLCAACAGLVWAGLPYSAADHQSKAIRYVQTDKKVVALTFDDGPNAATTPALLDVLRAKKVKATFFILGQNAEHNLPILSQTVADGHEIGSHSYSHHLLTRMSAAECSAELDKADEIISSVAPKPVLLRVPGGAYNDTVLQMASNKGYTVIQWSIDPRDWARPPVSRVVGNIMNNVKPGSIVLMHDGQPQMPTPEAVGLVIDRLRDQGYEILTVGELLNYQAPQ
jgi:peptidoglycan/xylan/chitin deacetylase (PgdA/CDA1 family)